MNRDGLVNITDVSMLINYLLGSENGIDLNAADMNDDDNINITDVTMLINYVMSSTR